MVPVWELCSGPRDGWVQEPLQMSCYSQGEKFMGRRDFRAKEQRAGRGGGVWESVDRTAKKHQG